MAKEQELEQQIEEAKQTLEAVKENFENKIERFDKYLSIALETDQLEDWIEGYIQLREAGFDWEDAFSTAALQLDIEIKEDSENKDNNDD